MGLGLSFGSSDQKQKSTRDQNVTGTTTQSGSASGWGNTQSSFWTPEQQGLASQLSGFLSGTFGQPTKRDQIANQALKRAASGEGYANIIDPAASDAMYAAIEKQTLEDILPKATRAMANEANLAGMLRSGPALQMQLDQRDQIVNELSKTLSGLRYQDELQRRQIEQDREGRQMTGAQALISANPQQQKINNILQMLGLRGTATEATQQQSQQQSIENLARTLVEKIKGKGSQDSNGLSLGLG